VAALHIALWVPASYLGISVASAPSPGRVFPPFALDDGSKEGDALRRQWSVSALVI